MDRLEKMGSQNRQCATLFTANILYRLKIAGHSGRHYDLAYCDFNGGGFAIFVLSSSMTHMPAIVREAMPRRNA